MSSHVLYNWLKHKFIKPAAADALKDVNVAPASETNWAALKIQILKTLEEDESFRKELSQHLASAPAFTSVKQNSTLAGNKNVVIQNTGTESHVQVNQPKG
jgi:hypothetical protein